jgi:hypothetical protein
MHDFIKLWRFGLILLGSLVVVFILYRYSGAGDLVLQYNFNTKPTFISEFTPLGRALDREKNLANGAYQQRIIGEPVYFTARVPGRYPKKLMVTLEYANPYQNIVELGIQKNNNAENPQYQIEPVQNKLINEASWTRLENKDYILLQKEQKYKTIEDFFANPPINSSVGTYHVNFSYPFVQANYKSTGKNIIIQQALLGSQEFYTYLKNQPLEFSLQASGAVLVKVYHAGEQVYAYNYSETDKNILINDLPEGVYKIMLETSADTVIDNIATKLQKLVFGNKVQFAQINNTDSTTAIYTAANTISLTPTHYSALGEAKFFDKTVRLDKVNSTYSWSSPITNYFARVVLPNNGLKIVSDAPISLDEFTWFDPNFGFAPLSNQTDIAQLDYVLAKQYTKPTEQRNVYTVTKEYDLTTMERAENNTFKFVLSAPGLAQVPQGLTVYSIKVTAEREPITLKYLWEKIN